MVTSTYLSFLLACFLATCLGATASAVKGTFSASESSYERGSTGASTGFLSHIRHDSGMHANGYRLSDLIANSQIHTQLHEVRRQIGTSRHESLRLEHPGKALGLRPSFWKRRQIRYSVQRDTLSAEVSMNGERIQGKNVVDESLKKWGGTRRVASFQQSTSLQPLSRVGLALEPCVDDDSCQSDRICFLVGDDDFLITSCNGSRGCQCIPPLDDLRCDSDGDCLSGEECFSQGNEEGSSNCVSISNVMLTFDNSDIDSTETSLVDPSSSDGLTGSPCASDINCMGSRVCKISDTKNCEGEGFCVCIPPTSTLCMRSEQCPDGEVCTSGGDETRSICLGPSVVLN